MSIPLWPKLCYQGQTNLTLKVNILDALSILVGSQNLITLCLGVTPVLVFFLNVLFVNTLPKSYSSINGLQSKTTSQTNAFKPVYQVSKFKILASNPDSLCFQFQHWANSIATYTLSVFPVLSLYSKPFKRYEP